MRNAESAFAFGTIPIPVPVVFPPVGVFVEAVGDGLFTGRSFLLLALRSGALEIVVAAGLLLMVQTVYFGKVAGINRHDGVFYGVVLFAGMSNVHAQRESRALQETALFVVDPSLPADCQLTASLFLYALSLPDDFLVAFTLLLGKPGFLLFPPGGKIIGGAMKSDADRVLWLLHSLKRAIFLLSETAPAIFDQGVAKANPASSRGMRPAAYGLQWRANSAD